MRVIGGTARGRALKAPSSTAVRPTSSRAREAIFDALSAMDVVEGAEVLDLFCGSGAMGIEALSRGASRVTFVDHDRSVIEIVEQNLASTGFTGAIGTGEARVVRRDAVAFVAAGGAYDLAFVDPPYRYESWPAVLHSLDARIAVLESDRELELAERYEPYRSYRYGSTLVHIVKRAHGLDGGEGR